METSKYSSIEEWQCDCQFHISDDICDTHLYIGLCRLMDLLNIYITSLTSFLSQFDMFKSKVINASIQNIV